MKTEMFKCDVCGKTAKLETGKRHWCDCNPTAPFYMHSVKMRKLTDQLIGGLMGGLRPVRGVADSTADTPSRISATKNQLSAAAGTATALKFRDGDI